MVGQAADRVSLRAWRGFERVTLKARLALVVVALMSALVLSYSLVLLTEVKQRVDAETQGALPWVVELLPARVEAMAPMDGPPLDQLLRLMHSLDGIRHAAISLHAPDGRVLAHTLHAPRALPPLFQHAAPAVPPLRKNVWLGNAVIAYFEVLPATNDELAELWDDFVRSALLVVALSCAAGVSIVWFTFRAFQPVDRIRDALRRIGSGQQDARLPRFHTPEMDEIATAFNRMAGTLQAAQRERQDLMRKLVESEEHTRRSVAHDLHDDLSPYLVAMQPLGRLLQMQCAAREDLRGISAAVGTLVSHQSHLLSTVRRILVGLHPPELETLGLRGAIEQLIAQRDVDAAGRLRLRLDAQGDWQGFGPVLDTSIYRMVQECVTNALRHSGGTEVDVRIALDPAPPAAIEIVVANDCAAGLPSSTRPGLGTLGMRERCLALGGQIDTGPAAGGGWQVSIRLPVLAAADAAPHPAAAPPPSP